MELRGNTLFTLLTQAHESSQVSKVLERVQLTCHQGAYFRVKLELTWLILSIYLCVWSTFCFDLFPFIWSSSSFCIPHFNHHFFQSFRRFSWLSTSASANTKRINESCDYTECIRAKEQCFRNQFFVIFSIP